MNSNKPFRYTSTSSSGLRQLSKNTEELLRRAVHRKTMKTLDTTKNNKTRKHIPSLSGRVSKLQPSYQPHNSNNKRTRYSIKRHPDYLEQLVSTYYDNDESAHKYLATAHRRMHILPPARRIIVIGDIHGDFDAAIKCLILAGCIAPCNIPEDKTVENMDVFFKSLVWTGGDTQVVQLGDQIDRVRPSRWDRNSISQTEAHEDEGSTLEIFFLFWYLNRLAQQEQLEPGAVHCIIGNHEIMNVEGNFSYVSSAEFKSFKEHLAHVYPPNSKYPYHSRTLKNTRETRKSRGLPVGYRERLYAFSPTGLCSNFMARNYYTMLQIGNWLFCHGSPTLATLGTYEIDLINTITSMYLLGLDTQPAATTQPTTTNQQIGQTDNQLANKIEWHFDNIMNDDTTSRLSTSIIWSRTFGFPELSSPSTTTKTTVSNLCALLDKILATYNSKNNNTSPYNTATHIAIGHTAQIDGNQQLGINSICNGRVWRCDVGMSKAFTKRNTNKNARKIQVLEIINNKPRVITY